MVVNCSEGLNGVNFETGSAQLTVGARSVLDNVASQLLKFPSVRIQINAHTDNLGGKAFNLDLSRKRIVSVARYLGSKGISSSRLAGRAFGESKPIASNDTEEGRARNRRVEMIAVSYTHLTLPTILLV